MRHTLVSALLTLSATAAASEVTPYGAWTEYRLSRAAPFAHFTLEYLGERHVENAHFPPGFTHHDFVATTPSERVQLSWSSGTGDIGPAPFTIAGERFTLELRLSDELGPLAANELVVNHLGPLTLEPPASATRLCGGHVTGVGPKPGTSGPHISWEAFASPEPPEALVKSYLATLGRANHEAVKQGCDLWRFPPDTPRRVLEVCSPEPPGPWRDCAKPPAGTRSVVVISTMAR